MANIIWGVPYKEVPPSSLDRLKSFKPCHRPSRRSTAFLEPENMTPKRLVLMLMLMLKNPTLLMLMVMFMFMVMLMF